jgi:hypothetical protein
VEVTTKEAVVMEAVVKEGMETTMKISLISSMMMTMKKVPLVFLSLLRLIIAVPGWKLKIWTFKVAMNFAEESLMGIVEMILRPLVSGTFGTLKTEISAVLKKMMLPSVTVTIEIPQMAQLFRQSKIWLSQKHTSLMAM